jgi:xanthine dehydrogenase accessory factor
VELFARVLEALDAGEAVAVAAVVGTAGSTPRHLGARMAVWADGRQLGSIGGGRIELEVVTAGREVAAGAPPRRVVHHLVHDLAMCCGGKMEIAVAPAGPGAEAMRGALAARRERTWAVLETPADGSAMAIRPPAPGERADLATPRSVEGGLVELVAPPDRAVVFGCGHVGRALGPILASLGFEVVVCDDGETGAIGAATPGWATHVIESFEVADVARALGGLGAGDHVLIVTRDHAIDQRILEALIGNDDLSYLGLIGSRGKVGRFEKRLRAKGLVDDARWRRLHAPIGLDLGSETPAEIAVAVAAELVALRRRGPAGGRGAGGEAGG